MKKNNIKKLIVTALVVAAAFQTSLSSFAGVTLDGKHGEWKRNEIGWWWEYRDGTWPSNCWVWIDGNEDRAAECYYFDNRGYMIENTITPDNYQVNADGAWISNGIVQKKEYEVRSKVSIKSSYKDRGWLDENGKKRYIKSDGTAVVNTPYLIDDNNDGVYEIYSFGQDGYLQQRNENHHWNSFGTYDSAGRLTTDYYGFHNTNNAGQWGAYELIQRDGMWLCVNGTMPADNQFCGYITNDYAKDALTAMNIIDEHILLKHQLLDGSLN